MKGLRGGWLFAAWLAALPAHSVEYRMIAGAEGIPLQVAEAGPPDAPSVLFLHGATMSSNSWLPALESELADEYHLVAFDLRGHGNSGKPWNPEAYADSMLWATDVAAVMEATGLNEPIVVAWSYGGHVTLDYIRHYQPAAISGLVLVGSTAGMLPFPPPDAARAAEFARLGQLAMSPDAGDRLIAARDVVDGMTVEPLPEHIREREVASVLAITPLVRQVMQGRALDNADLLSDLQMPVLFILGDADRVADVDSVEALARKLPNASVAVARGMGHMPFHEDPDWFYRTLLTFIETPGIETSRHATAPDN